MAEQHKTKFGGEERLGAGRGRPPLPQGAKKVRVEVYVAPLTAEWIEANGGSAFAASLLASEMQSDTKGEQS